MSERLSDEQIRNWRQVLVGMLGPYALVMPDDEVQAVRDRMQERANAFAAQKEAKE